MTQHFLFSTVRYYIGKCTNLVQFWFWNFHGYSYVPDCKTFHGKMSSKFMAIIEMFYNNSNTIAVDY